MSPTEGHRGTSSKALFICGAWTKDFLLPRTPWLTGPIVGVGVGRAGGWGVEGGSQEPGSLMACTLHPATTAYLGQCSRTPSWGSKQQVSSIISRRTPTGVLTCGRQEVQRCLAGSLTPCLLPSPHFRSSITPGGTCAELRGCPTPGAPTLCILRLSE